MADDAARSRLGRGLAALIGDVGAESQSDRPRRAQPAQGADRTSCAPIRAIRASCSPKPSSTELSRFDPRARHHPADRRARARGADSFEIIAGERRWRAAQRAGLHEVPIVVLDVTDGEALELAIIENVQRADLNPLEEATGYQSLADEFNHSQDDIAKIVGKSRSHIANTLRLLKLPERVKAYINAGKLTAGHARMLVGQPNAEELADQIVNQGLNVRQVEAMARKSGKSQARAVKPHRTARQGRRHRGAGDPADRCARSRRDDRPSRQRRRHVAGALSHAGAARRRDRAAGARAEDRGR